MKAGFTRAECDDEYMRRFRNNGHSRAWYQSNAQENNVAEFGKRASGARQSETVQEKIFLLICYKMNILFLFTDLL